MANLTEQTAAPTPSKAVLEERLAELPEERKNHYLRQLLNDEPPNLSLRLRNELLSTESDKGIPAQSDELLGLEEILAEVARARENRNNAQAAAQRREYARQIEEIGKARANFRREVDYQLRTTGSTAYDRATEIIQRYQEWANFAGEEAEFKRWYVALLREQLETRPAMLRRIKKIGL